MNVLSIFESSFTNRHNPAYPTETDQHGNLNNIIKVVAKRPEYNCDEPLMPISEASSPRESYDYSTLPQEDHATEPPTLPRLLASAPLNKSLSSGGGGTDFVRLNHIFETNSDVVYGANEVRTIACEIRYKSKIITTVLVMSKRKVVAQGLLSEQQAFENNTGQANSGMTTPAGLSLGESQSLILDALNNV